MTYYLFIYLFMTPLTGVVWF